MKANRSILILGALHVFLFVSMVWLSYAAEKRWHLIQDDLWRLSLLTRPIQYLAFSGPLFFSCLVLFSGLLTVLWKNRRAGVIVLTIVDAVFVLMTLHFALFLIQLELPFLPWRDQLRYIFQEIWK